MSEEHLHISVDEDLAAKGIKVAAARISIPANPRRPGAGLEAHINVVIASLDIDTALASPILAESRRLQKEGGIDEPIAPAEHLVLTVQRTGRFPNINRLVDAYNIVSLQTGISLGAHDIAHLVGDTVRLKVTDGSEKYRPLGQSEDAAVAAGAYAAVDGEKVICLMDAKQCDETKCTADTREVLIYAQGNVATTQEDVHTAILMVCENVATFLGGRYSMIQVK